MRIVSLIASSTEIVCALGFESSLVGRSHECDYPASVEKLPACSETKIDIHASSVEIDRQVKSVVEEALSVYKVNAEKLKELKPDIIITQDQCEVCAVSLKDVESAVCEWLQGKPKIVSLNASSLTDVFNDIRRIADALGAPERAEELIQSCQRRMEDIGKQASVLERNPSVACIEWFNPLMVAGNWVPQLVDLLDAKDLFGVAGEHSPWIKWEKIKMADPDCIITMPCGWGIEQSRSELYNLTDLPGWSDLKAVKEGKVFLTDGNQYFNRPGPRLVESLEILAEIFYPDVFNFKHKGMAWQAQ